MPNVAAFKLCSSCPLKGLGVLLVLDHLALQQQINANFILHAITNYKKSPSERKTLDFIDKKWLSLLGLWREFQRRHRQIRRDYRNVEPQHGYFQQELYALIQEKYMAARSLMGRDKRNLLKCKASQASHVYRRPSSGRETGQQTTIEAAGQIIK